MFVLLCIVIKHRSGICSLSIHDGVAFLPPTTVMTMVITVGHRGHAYIDLPTWSMKPRIPRCVPIILGRVGRCVPRWTWKWILSPEKPAWFHLSTLETLVNPPVTTWGPLLAMALASMKVSDGAQARARPAVSKVTVAACCGHPREWTLNLEVMAIAARTIYNHYSTRVFT